MDSTQAEGKGLILTGEKLNSGEEAEVSKPGYGQIGVGEAFKFRASK